MQQVMQHSNHVSTLSSMINLRRLPMFQAGASLPKDYEDAWAEKDEAAELRILEIAAIPGSPTLYSATFFLAMNKAKYEAVPADLRAIIDKHSGMAFATRAGKMWDEAGAAVQDMVKKRGNTISAISVAEKAKWIKACEPVTTAWIEQVKSKGLDGAKLIQAAMALVAKHNKV